MGFKELHPDKQKWFIEVYPSISNPQIAEELNINITSVQNFAYKLGLRKSDEFIFNLRSEKGKIGGKNSVNHNYFNEMNTAEKWYWAGWLWADGCVHKPVDNNGFMVSLKLQHGDFMIIDRFKEDLEIKSVPREYQFKVGQKQYGIRFSSAQIHRDLARIGIIPNKSVHAKYPPNIDDIFLPHFIRGVFEGDGCIYNAKRYSTLIIIGTGIFCDWINTIIYQQLGISGKTHQLKTKSNCTWEYRVSARHKISTIANWMYQDCGDLKLERKYNKFIECGALNG